MENIDHNDFANICRTCLSNYELKSIQQNNIIIEILRKLGVHVETSDDLPQQICFNCFEKINEIHEFTTQCNETYSSLMKCLNNFKNKRLKQEQDVVEETNEAINMKEEITIEEHNFEFVTVDVTLIENAKIKQEMINEEMFNETDEYIIPETSEDNSNKNIYYINKTISDSGSLPSDIPAKSKKKYVSAYDRFIKWCSSKNLKDTTSEAVLLTYFETLSKKYKSTSLWAFYSMLRAMISMKNNVDISKYVHLVAFLKKQAKDYKPRKSKTFTIEEVAKFLREAGDLKYLMFKVALIIGLVGSCRKEELTNLLLENVKDKGKFFHFQIPNARTKAVREFFVTPGIIEGVNMVEIIRKYVKERNRQTGHGRFFVGYKNGVCMKQPVGINYFGGIPKSIATYLNLSNPEEYTGHCFRRSSTSVFANRGPLPFNLK